MTQGMTREAEQLLHASFASARLLPQNTPHEALEVAQRGIIVVQSISADLLMRRGQYEEAERFYLTGLEMTKSIGDVQSLAFFEMSLGKLAVLQGKPKEAIPLLQSARQRFVALALPNQIQEVDALLAPIETYQTANKYPIEQTERLLLEQFGTDEDWLRVNHAIWDYFRTSTTKRLGLSEIQRMATDMNLSIDSFLAALNLFARPRYELLRRVYYRRSNSAQDEEISHDEVISQLRRWRVDEEIDEFEWQRWAAGVLIGWQLVSSNEEAN
jgi:hypothetical protein